MPTLSSSVSPTKRSPTESMQAWTNMATASHGLFKCGPDPSERLEVKYCNETCAPEGALAMSKMKGMNEPQVGSTDW